MCNQRIDFIVTPKLKKKVHYPLIKIGVDAEVADDLDKNNGIKTVGDILRWEWDEIPEVVQEALLEHKFTVSGARINWLEQRVVTIHMQELTECSPEEIGVELRNCNALEDARGVQTVGDLLCLKIEQLDGIQNFGEVGKQQVLRCLDDAGFVRGRNICWINEQDTDDYQRRLHRGFDSS